MRNEGCQEFLRYIYIYTYIKSINSIKCIFYILSSSYTCYIHCTYLLESSWIHPCHNANDVMDYSKNGLQYTYRFHPPSLWKIMMKIWTRKTETQTRRLWWPIAGDIHMAHKWTQRLPQINLIQRIWCHSFSVKLDMEKSDLLPTQILSQTLGQERSRQYFPPTFLIFRSCFSVSLPCRCAQQWHAVASNRDTCHQHHWSKWTHWWHDALWRFHCHAPQSRP